MICSPVASNLLISPRINWPQCMHFFYLCFSSFCVHDSWYKLNVNIKNYCFSRRVCRTCSYARDSTQNSPFWGLSPSKALNPVLKKLSLTYHKQQTFTDEPKHMITDNKHETKHTFGHVAWKWLGTQQMKLRSRRIYQLRSQLTR